MRPTELENLLKTMRTAAPSRLDRRVYATIDRAAEQPRPRMGVWRIIMQSPITKLAVAAAFIVGMLFLAQILIGDEPASTPSPEHYVTEPPETPSVVPTQDNLALARTLYEQRDQAGLLELLPLSSEPTQIVIAGYLAEIGDEEAVPALQKLADAWQGQGGNPYQQAIEQIKSRITPSAEMPEQEKTVSELISLQADPGMDSAPEVIGCQGRVVNRQGQGLAGANVLLYYDGWGTLDDCVLARGITDGKGDFALAHGPVFKRLTQHHYDRDKCLLIATHDDYAFGWTTIEPGLEKSHYEVVLTEPTEHTLTIVDVNDQPLPGVRVWVDYVGDRQSSDPLFRQRAFITQNLGVSDALSDVHGEVRLTNLPQTYCSYYATLDGYAKGMAFSDQTKIRLTQGATVSGHVLGLQNQPIKDAVVVFCPDGMSLTYYAKTNDRGEFSLVDLPAAGWDKSAWGEGETGNGSYVIRVHHDQYCLPGQTISLKAGEVVDDLVLEAYRETTLIHCKVVTIDTLEPLAGARVIGSNAIGRINGYTDVNGVFSVRVLPGETSLFASSPPDGVYVLSKINFEESATSFEASGSEISATLKFSPIAGLLTEVVGQIAPHPGMNPAEVKIYPSASESFRAAGVKGLIDTTTANAQGEFLLKSVPAGLGLHLYAESQDHRLAGAYSFAVSDDSSEEPLFIDLKLFSTGQATVTIVDHNDVIVPDNRFMFTPIVDGVKMGGPDRFFETNENGQAVIEGIIPGLTYQVRDAKFDSVMLWTPEFETWVDVNMVFIPVDDVPTSLSQ